jgi:UDP-N-acetylmuramoylalanine--D-glutamate ligase
LATFEYPPHRIERVGVYDGVAWYNDSKATTPHAAITAIRGFRSIVLMAGGRNKGLDLASLALEHDRVKAVVALGEAASTIHDAFAPWCPVAEVDSMHAAVDAAATFAAAGDTVLLSPACASFDWYPEGGYPARGDDFKRLVHARFGDGGQ